MLPLFGKKKFFECLNVHLKLMKGHFYGPTFLFNKKWKKKLRLFCCRFSEVVDLIICYFSSKSVDA